MARIKQTVRIGTYQKVDDAPKEDDDAPKVSSFDGVQHNFLRLNPTTSNDTKNRHKLWKDVKNRDESDNKDYTSGDNSKESFLKDNNSNEEENNDDDSSRSNNQE
eukprot:7456351-Ditylum_brightwellii.AAC.1